MLGPDEVELIHREIDGESTPGDRAAYRALLAREPAARTLAAELRELGALLDRVEQRDPPAGLRPAVLAALREHPCAPREAAFAGGSVQALVRWFVLQLQSATIQLERVMITKRALVLGSTTVAAIAVAGVLLSGYPPTGREGGTMGGLQATEGDPIAGVQQASRFRNKAVTERDVTLANPEIQLLFQNHQVLSLVKSDAFRAAMRDDAFRQLQSSDAFYQLMKSDAYRELLASDAYRQMQSSEAYRELLAMNAGRSVEAREAYARMQSSQAFHQLQANDAFRAVMASDAFRTVMSNDAYRVAMANDAFRTVMANDAFRTVLANDAYRQLQSAEVFRSLSRSQSASEAFLSQAMRVDL